MADTRKSRTLVVLCKHCKQIIHIFTLPPKVKLETAGDPRKTKFNLVCGSCHRRGTYPFDQTFGVES